MSARECLTPNESTRRITPVCPAIQAAIMTLAARIRMNCKELRACDGQMYWMRRRCIRDMADVLRELRWATQGHKDRAHGRTLP